MLRNEIHLVVVGRAEVRNQLMNDLVDELSCDTNTQPILSGKDAIHIEGTAKLMAGYSLSFWLTGIGEKNLLHFKELCEDERLDLLIVLCCNNEEIPFIEQVSPYIDRDKAIPYFFLETSFVPQVNSTFLRETRCLPLDEIIEVINTELRQKFPVPVKQEIVAAVAAVEEIETGVAAEVSEELHAKLAKADADLAALREDAQKKQQEAQAQREIKAQQEKEKKEKETQLKNLTTLKSIVGSTDFWQGKKGDLIIDEIHDVLSRDVYRTCSVQEKFNLIKDIIAEHVSFDPIKGLKFTKPKDFDPQVRDLFIRLLSVKDVNASLKEVLQICAEDLNQARERETASFLDTLAEIVDNYRFLDDENLIGFIQAQLNPRHSQHKKSAIENWQEIRKCIEDKKTSFTQGFFQVYDKNRSDLSTLPTVLLGRIILGAKSNTDLKNKLEKFCMSYVGIVDERVQSINVALDDYRMSANVKMRK